MNIPNCYEPNCQEERRQLELDRLRNKLPFCAICGHTIYPGDRFRKCCGKCVCTPCFDKLGDSDETAAFD